MLILNIKALIREHLKSTKTRNKLIKAIKLRKKYTLNSNSIQISAC